MQQENTTWLGGLTAEEARHEMPWWEWPEDLAEAIERQLLGAIGGQPCVYMLGEPTSRRVKIGRTIHARKRVMSLRTMNARRLVVIGLRYGGQVLERTLHVKLGGYRTHGEWFNGAPEVHDYFFACPDVGNPTILHEIREDGRIGKPWSVVNTITGRVVGRYATETNAEDGALNHDMKASDVKFDCDGTPGWW